VSKGSDAIGPTAHFTGHVWARNGLSHPELDTTEGLALYELWRWGTLAGRPLGIPSLDGFLLARHVAIDSVLEREIAAGRVGQVLEVASGMSPRGWRFTERHPELVYVETDLPAMLSRKRAALERIGRPANHRTAELDVLAEAGTNTLAHVVATELDPGIGLAIVTEGLLSYLPRDAVLDLWQRFAETIASFPSCIYTADLHVDSDAPRIAARAFEAALSTFVRGRVSVHFDTQAEAEQTLRDAGFAEAHVRVASAYPDVTAHREGQLVRIVEAAPTARRGA
jgi:O-methyltransferase involved in polyketide biosynthesis